MLIEIAPLPHAPPVMLTALCALPWLLAYALRLAAPPRVARALVAWGVAVLGAGLAWPSTEALGLGWALRLDALGGMVAAAGALGLAAAVEARAVGPAVALGAAGAWGLAAVADGPAPALGVLAIIAAVAAPGGGRAAVALLALGGAAALAVLAGPHPTAVVQLRLLGGAAGVAAAILYAAQAPRGHRSTAAWVLAQLAPALVFWAALRWAAPRLPDAWRLVAPFAIWGAPVLAALGAFGAWSRRPRLAALGPLGPALAGLLVATTAGVAGAAAVVAGLTLTLAAPAATATGRALLTAAATGVPGGLVFAGAAAAGLSALHAVGPAAQPVAVSAAVALCLLGVVGVFARLRPGGPVTPFVGVALAASLLGGVLPLFLQPLRADARAVAIRIGTPALPADDWRGWRRLSRLAERARSAPAADAGP